MPTIRSWKPSSPRARAADRRLRREYSGFGLIHHETVFRYQKKRCAICRKPVLPGKPRLAVDHDHATGKLRGLLCPWCNRALARFRDNIDLLLRAAKYLMNPPITRVFGREWFSAPGRIGTKKRAKLLRLLEELNETASRKAIRRRPGL